MSDYDTIFLSEPAPVSEAPQPEKSEAKRS